MTRQPRHERTVDRRTALRYLAALGLAGPATAALAGCGMGDGMMSGSGMPDWMMGDGMMDGQMMADMTVIHDLLTGHDQIRRQVDDTADGIHSRTTSTDRGWPA